MYEKLNNCPVCESESFDNKLICQDHLVSNESFVIVECESCGFQFTNPRPSQANIGKYYQSEQYISHSDSSRSLFDRLYKTVRYFTLRTKRSIVQRYSNKGHLLDYGCGTGDFLKVCKDSGWDIAGVEPDKRARENAARKLGVDLHEELPNNDNKYDAITLWHVLEHVHDLKGTLSQLLTIMKKEGIMFVAVPNRMSYDAEYYKEYWAAYDLPRHLYHFTSNDIKSLTKKAGAKVIDILPMKLDAFYVSMLSEKNRASNTISGALKVGLRSNRLAKKSKEHSSKIYVIKKI